MRVVSLFCKRNTVNRANEEIAQVRTKAKAESAALHAGLRKEQMKVESLERALQQKVRRGAPVATGTLVVILGSGLQCIWMKAALPFCSNLHSGRDKQGRPWDSRACWWELSWAACREEVRGPHAASSSSEAPFFLSFCFYGLYEAVFPFIAILPCRGH